MSAKMLLGVETVSRTIRHSSKTHPRQPEEANMATSKKDAKLASKQISSKKSTKAQKSVAASHLAQTKKAAKKKK